ncbi:MAG: serine/threonine protein kinase [Bacteroidetes bacterium]|nr:MAG: serine/threonine protein kinase [Bacteroidota bacterium]TAG86278.1 MAG: serine/threonine protein kinase [Bacteroidota bacterium]
MQKGDIIKGYLVLQDFKTAGGGLSKWTFASKNKQVFFMKEFLSPKYPTPDAPGSALSKQNKKIECEKFEERHQNIRKALQEKCGIGGNLVITLDFFRQETKYYKVTEKIEVASLSTAEISNLSLDSQILILKTITHSLNVLHKANIVHSDLKPDNILIKQTKTGNYTAKLIDFDDSYFSGLPPILSEDVVGDMVFYSPELASYVKNPVEENAQKLTTKSDIFALGLLFCVYLTNELPPFFSSYQYACLAANNNQKIIFAPEKNIPAELLLLINKMLSTKEKLRPEAHEIFEKLKIIDIENYSEINTRNSKENIKINDKIDTNSKIIIEENTESSGGLRGKGLNILKKNK